MIPLLAKNAVKVKSGFTTACMTGNYECAYALGIVTAAAGLEKEQEITDIVQLHRMVLEKIVNYEPEGDNMVRLLEMLREYEPSEKCDEQMQELYYVGFDDKKL
ncbi:MAG: DUF3837 domain-containing protein [Lachnospira sp.]|nr:DUF3837 domain-containing protein [Lachnospira sp.]